jgi:hypothetical protein
MDADQLRAVQAPLKDRYRGDAKAGLVTLKANGALDSEGIACKVETGRALAVAGLHPRPEEAAPNCVPATCCSKPWSRARA